MNTADTTGTFNAKVKKLRNAYLRGCTGISVVPCFKRNCLTLTVDTIKGVVSATFYHYELEDQPYKNHTIGYLSQLLSFVIAGTPEKP